MASDPQPVATDNLQSLEKPLAENPPATQPEPVYWPQLDGLRALAFLLVFLEHQSPIPLTAELTHLPGIPLLAQMINQAMRWGWVGVDLFFVLSAFLITTLLVRERQQFGAVSFKLFFLRRALRIWPLYFLVLALGFGVLPAFNYYEFPWGSLQWIDMVKTYLPASLLFLGNFKQTAIQAPPLSFAVGITWSVAMEEQFYLVWGWLVSRIRSVSRLGWIALAGLPATLLIRLCIFQQFHHQKAFYFNTWSHLDPIWVGVGVALLFHTQKLPGKALEKMGPLLLGGPVLLFLVLALFFPPLESSHITLVFDMTAIALAGGSLLLSLLFWPPAQRWFAHPVMIWLGRLSFGLYLLHPLGKDLGKAVTLTLFGNSLGQNLLYAWGFYVVSSLAFTMLLAWLSWQLLEKHFHRLRKHFMRVQSGGC